MMKVLICGAGGLVGKAVIKELTKYSDEFCIYAAVMGSEHIDITDNRLNVIDNSEIETVLKNNAIDVMLQLAFPRNVSPEKWADGFNFAFEMLSLGKKYNVRSVINISSQSIYGWQRSMPADERSPLYINSPYTAGKYCSELMVNSLFADMPATNIRLSTIIGPDTKERVVNKFLMQVAEGKDITVRGGGQIFSFLDVRDAASALAVLIKNDASSWRRIYNLGTSDRTPLIKIAEMAIEIGKQHGYNRSSLIFQPEDIVLNNSLEVSALKEDFGWSSKYSLQESMEYIFASIVANMAD